MFNTNSHDALLDDEINVALAKLKTSRDNPADYKSAMDRVSELQQLKTKKSFKLPLDTLLICGTNIFGVLWLARFERENVIKAPNAFRSVMKVK